MSDEHAKSAASDFLLYTAPDGAVRVDVLLRDETVWLPQKALAELFAVSVASVSRHLKNIFESLELLENSVVAETVTAAADGKNYKTRLYNLDAIIAVGYRVNSREATQFRIWATATLREYLIKGFVLDDARLKQGGAAFGKDYFDELLEKIREIRTSERRFYQKITDIYATAADYDGRAPSTRDFFACVYEQQVQNKLHFAITGQTAAEIVHERADTSKPHMGLTNWKQAPDGKVLKSDVAVAKNYLSQDSITQLNRLVSAYLDLAENRAERGLVTKMSEWATFLDGFITLNSYDVLTDKGAVSRAVAKAKAETEFAEFRQVQDATFESDFDRFVSDANRLSGDEDNNG